MGLEQCISRLGEISAQEQGEGSVGEQGVSEVVNQRQCLGMEVMEHGIGLPLADKPNGICVHTATKQDHSPTCTKAVGIHIIR